MLYDELYVDIQPRWQCDLNPRLSRPQASAPVMCFVSKHGRAGSCHEQKPCFLRPETLRSNWEQVVDAIKTDKT